MSRLLRRVVRLLTLAGIAGGTVMALGSDPAEAHGRDGWRRDYHYYDRPVVVRPRYYYPPPAYYVPPPPPVYYAPPPRVYYAPPPPPVYYGPPSLSLGLTLPIR